MKRLNPIGLTTQILSALMQKEIALTNTSSSSRWIERPATLNDAAAVVEMFNVRSRHFYGSDQATEEQVRAWLSMPSFNLETDTRVVVDDNERVLAWGHLMDPGKPYVQHPCGVSVSIEHMDEGRLWDAIIDWCERRAREYIPLAPPEARVCVTFSGLVEDVDRWYAVERCGAKRVRIANRMRIDLDGFLNETECPKGIKLRAAALGTDLPALVAVMEEAFSDHWGHVEQPLDEAIASWREGIDSEGDRFDPSLWRLAMDREGIVGAILCSPDVGGDSTLAYVDSLAVRKAWRHRGLGSALLLHAFGELKERGKVAVELDMDSENLTGALQLYERVGMHVVRQEYFYEKELRAGHDFVVRHIED